MNKPEPTSRWKRSAAIFGTGFLVYLALSVVLWWGVWSSHPTSTVTCPCNDPALFVWFLEWPAYAISHGHNPFYSSSIFYPNGINLLSNTGVLSLGVPLAPVTWAFGPVAAFNVASTLGPTLSSLSMFWLLSRWTRWAPAAFIGGLVFGFSPFALVNLAVAHLNTEVLVLVPLMVACLDEIFVRQRRRPVVVGSALGVLVALQFFLSTEILAIVFICTLAALAMLVGYAAIFRRSDLIVRAPYGLRSLVNAAVVAIVLLGYPVWFALDGPAHLSGLVWPIIQPGAGGVGLGNIWNLHFLSASALRLFAGYEGPALPQGEYLGVGVLVVIGVGVVVWWREKMLWLFSALAVISVALSLGVTSRYWVPWRALAHIPLIQNVTPARFFAVTTLCVAIMVGIVVDRSHDLVFRLSDRSQLPKMFSTGFSIVVALGVGALATVPMVTAMATNVPFTTENTALPAWFTTVAPHLSAGQVVLTFPPPVSGGSALVWQATDSLHFPMATGGGPESIPERAGVEASGLKVISQASVVLSPQPPATPANVQAVRRALAGWRVTVVVVPDPSALLPRYDRTASTTWALGVFTLAIGRRPHHLHGAWVWSDVNTPGSMLSIALPAFARCTSIPAWKTVPYSVPDCVLTASGPP
jgi:hypothetical protein